MHRIIIGAVICLGGLWGQQTFRMGAKLLFLQGGLLNATDRSAPATTALRPTFRVGGSGFFLWGWHRRWGTGLEVTYHGAGQNYYGAGLNGQNYAAAIRLSYLRLNLPLQAQYLWKTWGLWAQIGPSAGFLTQAELTYQGDSLETGTLYAPQVIQTTLSYLAQSTNPEDQLLQRRLYRRWQGGVAASGGVQTRLAPGVWVLALLSYQRDFTDAENKGYRVSPETPLSYDPRRKAAHNQLWGFQVGILYEVQSTPERY